MPNIPLTLCNQGWGSNGLTDGVLYFCIIIYLWRLLLTAEFQRLNCRDWCYQLQHHLVWIERGWLIWDNPFGIWSPGWSADHPRTCSRSTPANSWFCWEKLWAAWHFPCSSHCRGNVVLHDGIQKYERPCNKRTAQVCQNGSTHTERLLILPHRGASRVGAHLCNVQMP